MPSLNFVIMPDMLKKIVLYLFLLILLITSACGGQPIATQPKALTTSTTNTDDPCSSENLPTTGQGLNDLEAEDSQIPTCLGALKTHQLNHMNLMIQTLIALVGGASQEELNAGLENARKEHDLYSLEIVRLLGITLAPLSATPPP